MFADTLCELEFTAIAERMIAPIASAICFESHNASPLCLEELSRCVPSSFNFISSPEREIELRSKQSNLHITECPSAPIFQH
jgi:hypothetical protein